MSNNGFNPFLLFDKCGAFCEGHIVYKAGLHGNAYFDKKMLEKLDRNELIGLIHKAVDQAIENGLDFCNEKRVVIFTPATGAIAMGRIVLAYLSIKFPDVEFIQVVTYQDTVGGRKIHFLTQEEGEKLKDVAVLIFDDVMNNGTTCRECKAFIKELGSRLLGMIVLLDRNDQSRASLGIPQYYPYVSYKMPQQDPRKGECQFCNDGIPITESPGKGKEWIAMFGQPPYPPGTDFSAFFRD